VKALRELRELREARSQQQIEKTHLTKQLAT
jgi:hypothetical protein